MHVFQRIHQLRTHSASRSSASIEHCLHGKSPDTVVRSRHERLWCVFHTVQEFTLAFVSHISDLYTLLHFADLGETMFRDCRSAHCTPCSSSHPCATASLGRKWSIWLLLRELWHMPRTRVAVLAGFLLDSHSLCVKKHSQRSTIPTQTRR